MENVYIYKYCHTHIIMEEIEEKKENIISFRLNNADYLKLEQVSTEQNKKKSDIVRKALDFYLGFHFGYLTKEINSSIKMEYNLWKVCLRVIQFKKILDPKWELHYF